MNTYIHIHIHYNILLQDPSILHRQLSAEITMSGIIPKEDASESFHPVHDFILL